MNKHALLLLVAACGDPIEKPAENPPPSWGVPISGGSMIITRDGKFAVVADPDRDRIVTVDLVKHDVANELALHTGDEPGRLIEDGSGRIHVALRRGGDLLTLASPLANDPLRRAACPEPRGLAWQASTDRVHVACATGELVTFAAESGDAVRSIRVERDLRDVIVQDDQLRVTRFRTAELLTLDANGVVIDRATAPIVKRKTNSGGFPNDCPNCGGAQEAPQVVDALPAVAWRALPLADGAVLLVHQRQVNGRMKTSSDGYGIGCGGDGPVESAFTVIRHGQAPFAASQLASGTLPVDAALSPAGDQIAIVTAGNQAVHVVQTARLADGDKGEEECDDFGGKSAPVFDDLGAPTSVAYLPDGKLAVLYPESPAIAIHDGAVVKTIDLGGGVGYDSGRALFHRQTGSGLACASCHPEGRDDGLVWDFDKIGLRRTQSLAGNIGKRAPYHWNGDEADLETLMHDVFETRMAGGVVTRSQKLSLGPWLDRIPAPKPSIVDAAAVDRGRVLFDSAEVGCASCHGGAILSNNMLLSVGTGGYLKVPSLVGVGARAPYMHDGCATTLRDRFTANALCTGGDTHGKTSQLSAAQLSDLIAYLESL